MASSNLSAIRHTGPTMVTERIRRAIVIATLAALGGIAHAEWLPIAGILAPSENGPVLHALPGWRSSGTPLRYLDESGRALCCLHVAPMPTAGASASMRDGEAGGDLYAVEPSDALAARTGRKPMLGPVLDTGTTTEKRSAAEVPLRKGDHRSQLERCTTSEGVRFTLQDKAAGTRSQLYLPLGYDVSPTCK